MYEPIYHPQFNIHISHPIPIACAHHNNSTIYPKKWNADPPHIHSALEILFIRDNEVSFLLGDNVIRVPGGSAVISKPNEIHMCIFDPDKTYNVAPLWIDADLTNPIFSFLYEPDYRPVFRFDDDTFARIDRCLRSLSTDADPLTHFADIVRILALLNASKGNEIRDLPLPEILQGVIDDIGVNLTSIRSVGDLLERHFVSQATLNRYFRKYLHVSAQKYLQTQKLIYAAQLLKQGVSVTEACMRSGFTDTSRFIVQFKREFAMTPKQYQTFSKQQDASQNR